jgi:toxin ParE1/3/4
MRRRLTYRPEALTDLNETAAYTRRTWGGAKAKQFVGDLVADINSLRKSALRYPLYDQVHPGLRRKRSAMHHIYYLASEERVEILRIIHVQLDPGLHLKVETWSSEE